MKMNKVEELCITLYNNSVARYIFFGGLTTLVNLGMYFCLRQMVGFGVDLANFISICTAILFAYFVNSRFVFQSKPSSAEAYLKEFVKFVGARLSTMFVEMGGVWLFTRFEINDMLGKFLVQFVVLVLNYIFSKFLVFRKGTIIDK